MYIMKTNRNDLELESNIANLRKEDNIIYKAYRKLKERFKEISGVKVRLIKKYQCKLVLQEEVQIVLVFY